MAIASTALLACTPSRALVGPPPTFVTVDPNSAARWDNEADYENDQRLVASEI
jgi:hypothetical protein